MSDKPEDEAKPRTRMVACPHCGGEGFFEDYQGVNYRTGEPDLRRYECEGCNGTGGIEVELEPITLDDLDALSGATT